MQPAFRRSHPSLLAVVALATVACDASPAGLIAPEVPGSDVTALATALDAVLGAAPDLRPASFDPQPEPPGTFRFSVASFPGTELVRGSITGCGTDASVAVRTLSSQRVGDVVYLSQSWQFASSASCRGVLTGACASVSANLRGVMSARTGEVALEGTTSGGSAIRVKGKAAIGATGPGGIAGEVMFNPQPDPPRWCLAA